MESKLKEEYKIIIEVPKRNFHIDITKEDELKYLKEFIEEESYNEIFKIISRKVRYKTKTLEKQTYQKMQHILEYRMRDALDNMTIENKRNSVYITIILKEDE